MCASHHFEVWLEAFPTQQPNWRSVLMRRGQHLHAQQPQGSMVGDELDMDLQARIAEQIRQQNVQQNMESAWEHSPEVFSDVYMLYVSMQV